MNISNRPQDHPCYVVTRARVSGLFKDETGGCVMSEFITLRAKYNLLVENRWVGGDCG